jgi:hypothetical protein
MTSKEYFTPKLGNTHCFCAVYGTCSNIDYILGHKASFNKFKKIKITTCFISDQNGIKLDLNNNRNPIKYSNTWRLKNTLLKKNLGDQSNKGRNEEALRVP